MIRLTCISNLLSFYTICFWTAFSSILFAFANLREKIWAHDLHCGENSFSMAARYPDWVDEIMGEAMWWEIWFIVNKPKRNVELKSIIGEVHCKHEKCCASEPFTIGCHFSNLEFCDWHPLGVTSRIQNFFEWRPMGVTSRISNPNVFFVTP